LVFLVAFRTVAFMAPAKVAVGGLTVKVVT
jgi:hypothetical protein